MTTTTRSAPAGARRSADTTAGRPLRTWRTAVGLTALAGGAAVVAGCLLPWATAFAGLVEIPGIRGSNGKLLAVAGVLLVAAGAGHLIRGDAVTRWLIGVLGTAAAGYSGYLLLRLAGSLRSGIGDSMLLVRGGPGLWVVAGGGLLGLGTMFFPASSQSGWRALRADGASLAAWAADRTSAGPRRWLQLALGLVWLLDAALQFQPFMFTRGFVTRVIDPAAMGSPGVISRSVMGTGQLVLTHPALFNAAFATIQLALAAGLLWRRTTRLALAGTIVWALGVWWLGEGLGGLLTGTASPVTGAPGAALLYVVIAVLAWPRRADRGHQGPAEQHRQHRRRQPRRPACRPPGLGRPVGRLGRPRARHPRRQRRHPGLGRAGRAVRDHRGGHLHPGRDPARPDPGRGGRGAHVGARPGLRGHVHRQRHRPRHRPAAPPAGRRVLAAAPGRPAPGRAAWGRPRRSVVPGHLRPGDAVQQRQRGPP